MKLDKKARKKNAVARYAAECAANASSDGTAIVPASVRRSLNFLAVLAGVGALWAAQEFLFPTAIAIVLSLVLVPLVAALERLGLPNLIASAVVVATAFALIGASALLIAPEISDWLRRSPQVAQSIELKAKPIKDWLASVQKATDRLSQATTVPAGGQKAAPIQSQPADGILDLAPVAIAQTLYVFILALMLISFRHTYRRRMIMFPSQHENRLRMARILNETLHQVSSYFFVLTLINIGVGLTTMAAFFAAGVPYAVVWGFIFGVACYIPYFGPIATIALCAVVQFVLEPTLEEAIIGPAILLIINTVESNLMTPWLVSRRLAVSNIAMFLAVALLAWIWGPISSIIAVPILIVLVAIARHVPGLEPWANMLQDERHSYSDDRTSGFSRYVDFEKALCAKAVLPKV